MPIDRISFEDLNTTVQASFKQGVGTPLTEDYKRISQEVSSSGPANVYPYFTAIRGYREWLGPRQFQRVTGQSFVVPNREWENGLEIPQTAVEDDQVGLYFGQAEELGRTGVEQREELMFGMLSHGNTTLCYSGEPFFGTHTVGNTTVSNDMGGTGPVFFLVDTTRSIKPLIFQNRLDPVITAKTAATDDNVFYDGVLRWGARARNAATYGVWALVVRSRQPFNETNLLAAKARMQSFKSEEGRNYGLRPKLIVAGLESEDTVLKLLTQNTLAGGESNYLRFGGYETLFNRFVETVA